MTWTAPRTWAASELVTAAIMNTHVRDNLTELRSFIGARAYKSGTQSVTSGNYDAISFDTESFDTSTIHDNATNNSRFTVPSGYGGYWRVILHAEIDDDTNQHNRVELAIRKNAAGVSSGGTALLVAPMIASDGATGGANSFQIAVVASLVAGDYIEGFYRARDETQVLASGASSTSLTLEWIGA